MTGRRPDVCAPGSASICRCRVEHRGDVLGRVVVHRLGPIGLQAPPAACGGVARYVVVLDGLLHDLREQRDMHVDRARAQRPARVPGRGLRRARADLVIAVAVDLADCAPTGGDRRRTAAGDAQDRCGSCARRRVGSLAAWLRTSQRRTGGTSGRRRPRRRVAAAQVAARSPRRTSARTFASSSSARARVQPSSASPSVTYCRAQ